VNENGNRGTDHGHGNAMLAMGGGIKGGKVYGKWPGLAMDRRYEGRDLAVTTDFRDVFGEIVVRHMGLKNPQGIFPGYQSSPANFLTLRLESPRRAHRLRSAAGQLEGHLARNRRTTGGRPVRPRPRRHIRQDIHVARHGRPFEGDFTLHRAGKHQALDCCSPAVTLPARRISPSTRSTTTRGRCACRCSLETRPAVFRRNRGAGSF
jgi:hypothetical protein